MANVILLTAWTSGDVLPFIQLGSRLKTRGHEVTLLSNCEYERLAKDANLGFAAVDDAIEFERTIADTPLFNSPPGFPTFYRRHVIPKVRLEYELIKEHSQSRRTILVARWVPGIAARIASEALNIPLVSVLMAPSHLTTAPLMEELLTILSGEVNEIRVNLRLPPVLDWGKWLKNSTIHLGLWPEWFGARENTWPGDMVLSGFLLGSPDVDIKPSSEIEAMIELHEPIILITGGTSTLAGAAFFRVAAEACQLLCWQGIIVTRQEKLIPKQLPSRVRWFRNLGSLQGVMPRMTAVLHHGGMGTLGQAIAAGVPQVVLAAGGDRVDNALRLQSLGVAEFLAPNRYTPESVSNALYKLCISPWVKENCAELANRLRSTDSCAIACEIVEAAMSHEGITVNVDAATYVQNQVSPTLTVETGASSFIEAMTVEKRAMFELLIKKRLKNNRIEY